MKLNLKDLEKYLFPIKRIFSKYKQIKTVEQVKVFIQEQSAQVSQMTLYGYLKTRMGAKHVLMFEDKDFLKSKSQTGFFQFLNDGIILGTKSKYSSYFFLNFSFRKFSSTLHTLAS